MNKDKLSDVALVIESLDTTLDRWITHDSTTENDKRVETTDTTFSRARILIILLRAPDNSFLCDAQADSIIEAPPNANTDDVCIGDPLYSPDAKPLTIRHGVLVIHMEQRCGGSYWKTTYRFRHQEGDWYLIGASAWNGFQGSPDLEEYDANLLTGNVRVGTATMDQPKESFKKIRLHKPPKHRLTDFRSFTLNLSDTK
ncbi:MAG: hypothetical protein Q8896_06270 [Bacteroidota bacterium]|nr:hypothetical protein [Bacteroidota bacterium]MDP4236194.1 hypothetical protein [Bacteroidota bacterium]